MAHRRRPKSLPWARFAPARRDSIDPQSEWVQAGTTDGKDAAQRTQSLDNCCVVSRTGNVTTSTSNYRSRPNRNVQRNNVSHRH